MNKILMYNHHTPKDAQFLSSKLSEALPLLDGFYLLKIANYTIHGLARIFERGILPSQKQLLEKLAADKLIKFTVNQVSEIRMIKSGDLFVIVSIVINDIVIAIQPLNFITDLKKMGYGITEGAGWGVIKTALERINVPSTLQNIGGYDVYRVTA